MKLANLSRPTFEQRLSEEARNAEQQASKLAAGPEREALLLKARQCNTASQVNAWINSPGLQPPKRPAK
jgi:hypothetical protein